MSAPASTWLTRHLGQHLERRVVHDLAVLHDAAVAVVHVLAQTDVGDHDELGHLVLDRPDGELHDALGIVGAAGRRVLVGGDAEQQDGRDTDRLISRTSGSRLPMESCSQPGMEGIGRLTFSPPRRAGR